MFRNDDIGDCVEDKFYVPSVCRTGGVGVDRLPLLVLVKCDKHVPDVVHAGLIRVWT